jgi:hypothetical protein
LLSITDSGSAVVYADALAPTSDQGNCVNCHENLYFLHDTGNWYCLKDAPMSCVDCHGGDPLATSQEQAHLKRAAHPVLNNDISKCQECHPPECSERVKLFGQNAGISQVLIAAPYSSSYSNKENADVSVEIPQQEQGLRGLLLFWEIIPLALVVGLALTIYLIHHTHHHKISRKEQP